MTMSRPAYRICALTLLLCAASFLAPRRTSGAQAAPAQAYPAQASPAQSAPAQTAPAQTPQTGYEDTSATTRKAYAAKVRQSYNFAFSKDSISLPGNAAVEGNDFLQPNAFPDAEYCGHCHQEAYHQWRQSLHSNSFRTPFYRTSVNILLRTKGIEFTRHCDSCHNPIGVLGGALDKNTNVNRSFDRDGLTCATCHSIQRVDSKLGNGGFVMGVPSVMVDEQGNRIPGIVPDSEILAHLDRHSKAVMQNIYHPGVLRRLPQGQPAAMLNDYKWIRAFTAYDEWQNSKFSKRNPLTFYTADFTTCQGCHMKRDPSRFPTLARRSGTFVSHRWLAGNTAVPFYYGFDEQLEEDHRIPAHWQLSQRRYLRPQGRRFRPDDCPSRHCSLRRAFRRYRRSLMVVIQNKMIGHSLIPEVRDLYEAWAVHRNRRLRQSHL
jgi:hypothetical protein